MSKTNKEITDLVIVASAAAQLLHEALDELEHTSYYKQTLKMATKRLQTELSKACDAQTNDLWEADGRCMSDILVGIEGTIKAAVHADPLVLGAIGNMLNHNPLALTEDLEIA